MDQFIHIGLVFCIQFIGTLLSLMFWAILIWVILSWLVLFRAMRPDNPGFQLFTQVVQPIIAPFRWARIGMIDLSPLVAIWVYDFLRGISTDFLMQFL